MTKKVLDITEETWPKYIAYMSKGQYEPKYTQGFSDETIQSYRALWVDITKDKPALQLYKEFERYIQGQIDYPRFPSVTYVVSIAHAFTFNKHQGHTWQMKKDQSQLIDDYCYRNNIPKTYHVPYQNEPK